MSDSGETNIVVMWTVGPDDVAESDRIFESHARWMTGHPRAEAQTDEHGTPIRRRAEHPHRSALPSRE
jgi:hypothetical protein